MFMPVLIKLNQTRIAWGFTHTSLADFSTLSLSWITNLKVGWALAISRATDPVPPPTSTMVLPKGNDSHSKPRKVVRTSSHEISIHTPLRTSSGGKNLFPPLSIPLKKRVNRSSLPGCPYQSYRLRWWFIARLIAVFVGSPDCPESESWRCSTKYVAPLDTSSVLR